MPKFGRQRNARVSDSHIRLHFLGAARMVTGSLHFFELETGGKVIRFFCDLGLDQEQPARNHQNRLPSGLRMEDVQFGIVSHPHIDHIGLIPYAVKHGFRGKIYATQAACDLSGILLPDSGYLQEQEAKRLLNRKRKQAQPGEVIDNQAAGVKVLYTEEDAKASLSHFQPVDFAKPLTICQGVRIVFSSASHLLGAAIVTLELGEGAAKRRVVFTGDLGRKNIPVLKDVAPIKQADYVICEGTYGDRLHERRDRQEQLAAVLNRAYKRALKGGRNGQAGVIAIPAFAVGRVQSILYDLRQLMHEKKLPAIKVFVDSPLAIKATAIYRKHTDLYNKEAAAQLARGVDIFAPPQFAELVSWQQSVALDAPVRMPIIIIASSGMAAGGRILRHLERLLPGKENTIVFVGHQARGTLGRQLTQPDVQSVRMGGKAVKVRATIEMLSGYSGHPDYEEIVAWLKRFEQKPRCLFLVHGEEEALLALRDRIKRELGWDVEVPRHRQYFDLN